MKKMFLATLLFLTGTTYATTEVVIGSPQIIKRSTKIDLAALIESCWDNQTGAYCIIEIPKSGLCDFTELLSDNHHNHPFNGNLYNIDINGDIYRINVPLTFGAYGYAYSAELITDYDFKVGNFKIPKNKVDLITAKKLIYDFIMQNQKALETEFVSFEACYKIK